MVVTPPAPIEGIDASGKWIVPGLIDVHVPYHPGWIVLFVQHDGARTAARARTIFEVSS